jgi:hypothetical protein
VLRAIMRVIAHGSGGPQRRGGLYDRVAGVCNQPALRAAQQAIAPRPLASLAAGEPRISRQMIRCKELMDDER